MKADDMMILYIKDMTYEEDQLLKDFLIEKFGHRVKILDLCNMEKLIDE